MSQKPTDLGEFGIADFFPQSQLSGQSLEVAYFFPQSLPSELLEQAISFPKD